MTTVTAFARSRVAVLDDNRNFQQLMRTMLRHLGFRHVEVFGDPDLATAHVVDAGVDLAFVDLVMPRRNGLQWAHSVRRLVGLANPDMAIVLVTGHAVRRILERVVAAGIDDVLVKPLAPEALYRHAEHLLTRPRSYVAGPGGYWGPDAAPRLKRLRQGIDDIGPLAEPTIDVGTVVPTPGSGRRSLPGLDVEIVDRSRYHTDALYLD